MDADIVMQRYVEYKQLEAKKLDEELEVQRQREEQQARIKAQWQATRLGEIHTATKDYTCENPDCGKTIPKGSRYRCQKIVTGGGWPEGFHYTTRKTHLICSVKKDGEKV